MTQYHVTELAVFFLSLWNEILFLTVICLTVICLSEHTERPIVQTVELSA